MNGETQKARPKGVHLKVRCERNLQCDVVVRTAPSALCWCGKVMFDRRRDQLGNACLGLHACTIRHRGRATRTVDQYTHGRHLDQNEVETGFECSQEARALERRWVLWKIPRCDIDGVGEGK